MPDNAWVAKILRLVKARVKPNANVLLKELSKIKWLNKILLHPWFNDLLSHHQRIFLLQKVLVQNPQLDDVQRVKELGTLGPKWDVFIRSLASGLRKLWRRGSRKCVGACRKAHTKETVSSRHSRTDAHMNSQRLRQHAQGLHGSVQNGVSILRGEWNYIAISIHLIVIYKKTNINVFMI